MSNYKSRYTNYSISLNIVKSKNITNEDFMIKMKQKMNVDITHFYLSRDRLGNLIFVLDLQTRTNYVV